MAVKDAWNIAQGIADALPPFLEDDELTIDRFYERNKGKISEQEARNLLEQLVEVGQLEKQERRRKGRGGSHIFAYIAKGK